ncbi:MAG: phosphatidylglycerophosphatase A [Planctomycetes bacterium]|nr:phosphatidylglycerophosphatase A [Planctomycetota bacterium]
MNAISKAIITGLGTGYLPIAPGSWASGAVCVVFFATAFVPEGGFVLTNAVMLVVAAIASGGCLVLGKSAEAEFGRKDPSQCTADEWAGQALSLAFLPIPMRLPSWQGYAVVAAVAFAAFRFFDIVKPPPARRLENLSYGTGILLDDICAGLYANIICQVILRLALFH